MLALQARGRRCVCLLDDAAARAHGDPRHPDGLAFALHDLCHLEKFVAPEHHAGQVGFFRLVERALETPAMAALDRALDDPWRADCDYIIADTNGSAVFLLAALKMRLGLAARRCGVGAEAAVDVLIGTAPRGIAVGLQSRWKLDPSATVAQDGGSASSATLPPVTRATSRGRLHGSEESRTRHRSNARTASPRLANAAV